MTILGGIWDKWASEDSIINTANRVRICSKISTDCKLDCSKGSSDNADPSSPKKVCTHSITNASQFTATPHLMSNLAKHCYGSTNFWKSI